ncbi:MAG: glycosyltransferase [Candidatus Babeliales bacterium]
MKKLLSITFLFSSLVCAQENFIWVDFNTSMQADSYKHILEKNNNMMLKNFFERLYNLFSPARIVPTSVRIPKIIHQIWLGSPFPEKYRAYQESWLKHNPGWEYKLWTDADVASFAWRNKDLFDASKNYGEKSDIWRYEILEQFGGIYIDTDFECLKSMNSLCIYDFYTGIQPLDTNMVQLNNALIASIPHHPLLQKCIEELRNSSHEIQIILRTGPLFFTKLFLKYVPSMMQEFRIVAFPASYFYPCGYEQRGTPASEWQKPESYAVHHWAGSWLKKEAFVQ